MEEVWKDIPGYYPYQASNLGRIRNNKPIVSKKAKGRKEALKTKITKNGYEEVSISIEGKPYTKSVHRLVALAFIENPDNKPEVDHIDANPLNNKVENLRWVTREENLHNDLYYGNRMKKMTSQVSIEEAIASKEAQIAKLQKEIEALKEKLNNEC